VIKGFLTGAFRPFHLGHEALIDFAKSNCDELTILITTLPDENIPYKYRLKWVLSTYLDDPKVTIVADTINEPTNLSYDELSEWWGTYIKEKYGHFDKVFTSEDYGDIFAKTMGAEHIKFNKLRTLVPISATMIRKKPLTYWHYLNNFAKDYFIKKIAIVGTESTGKTILAEQLANHYNTVWCPELGDQIVNKTEECTLDDIKLIGSEHAKHIIKYTRLANKLLFIDTDLSITKSYSKFLFNNIPEFEPWIEQANKADYYIFLSSDAPYVDNGRRLKKEERDILEKSHLEILNKNEIKYDSFSCELGYEYRLNQITNVIDKFIKKY